MHIDDIAQGKYKVSFQRRQSILVMHPTPDYSQAKVRFVACVALQCFRRHKGVKVQSQLQML